MTHFAAGDSGYRIDIDPSWRVLDVGSGESPHVRAQVLLDKFPEDDTQRSGRPLDATDPRLVIGDALHMPFRDGEFDYAIASHVAEHVDDPARFCAELSRVARAGYIETPGWLWSRFIEEPFHLWRVRRKGKGLQFERIRTHRPLGPISDFIYGIVYMGAVRHGRWTLRSERRPLKDLFRLGNRASERIRRLPGVRRLVWTCYEWDGVIPVEVRDRRAEREAAPGSRRA